MFSADCICYVCGKPIDVIRQMASGGLNDSRDESNGSEGSAEVEATGAATGAAAGAAPDVVDVKEEDDNGLTDDQFSGEVPSNPASDQEVNGIEVNEVDIDLVDEAWASDTYGYCHLTCILE